MKNQYTWLLTGLTSIILAAISLTGCNDEPVTPSIEVAAPAAVEQLSINVTPVPSAEQKLLWDMQQGYLSRTLGAAQALQAATTTMLNTPSAKTLTAAQGQWQKLQEPLEGTHFLLQGKWQNQPDPATAEQTQQLYYATFSWPISPGTLDYFGSYRYSGMVHDIGLAITTETLLGAHQATSEQDVVIGFYAIGFMLFGESGARPANDYAKATLTLKDKQSGFEWAKELPNNRRRALLETQVQLLLSTIENTINHWQQALAPTQLFVEPLSQASTEFISNMIVDLSEMKKASADPNNINRKTTQKNAAQRLVYQLRSWCEAMRILHAQKPDMQTTFGLQCKPAIERLNNVASADTEEPYRQAYTALKSLAQPAL